MSEIPEDVMQAAKSLVTGLCVKQGRYVGCRVAKWLEDAIARSIMAERERCAKVADDYATFYRSLGCVHRHHIVETIAKEIRMGDRSCP